MTATLNERESYFAGQYPAVGSLSAAAATKYLRGTMVGVDANNRAANVAAGIKILGIVAATYDNTSGANDSGNVEITYGVHAVFATGTAPKVGDLVYATDNQTVTLTPGTNGPAGIVSEIRTLNGVINYWVYFAPHVSGLVFAGLDANDGT